MKFTFLLLVAFLCFAASAQAQTTAFTYQGHLNEDAQSANGSYTMKFRLYNAETEGNQIGDEKTALVTVARGGFTISLDFGADAFPAGGERWLEIQVGTTTLAPRQRLDSVPYAVRSLIANQSDALSSVCNPCVTSSQIISLSGSKITGSVSQADNAANAANATNAVNATNAATATNALNLGGAAASDYLLKTGDGSLLTNIPGTFKWQTVTGTSQQAQPNNGYLANNAAQVAITLPSSPNVGDTVRVSGVGAGGWKIIPNDNQVIQNSLDYLSQSWIPRASNRYWQSIASSADGTKLAAVAYDGQIYTSTDSGATWTPREINRQWESIASSADGTKLVAVVLNGQIYTSTDSGITWTPRESNRFWYSVASSADGTKLAAVVLNGQIYTSTDSGITWIPRIGGSWVSIASSADGAKLAAFIGGGQIYTSTDSGVNWTPRESNRNWQSIASSADGTKLVAVVYNGQIYTSTDSGVTWTPREGVRDWYSVASSADGTKLAAVVSNGQIYTSTDSGATWTPRESNRQWISVAISADGTKLVAGTSNDRIYTSPLPATTATGFITGAQSSAIELQYIGDGKFMPISREGTISFF